MTLRDAFGREIRYLRLSVTDRCNLACFYCKREDTNHFPRSEVLTLEELETLALLFAREFGVEKVRLTGGEPLMRRGVDGLIRNLARAGLSLHLTTNGALLKPYARFLGEQGVKVNVSLDTLRQERFQRICGSDTLRAVLEGIEAALAQGIPLKLNTVLLKGINDDEIEDLLAFARSLRVPIRFIEFMPFVHRSLWQRCFLPEKEVMARIARNHTLVPVLSRESTARMYELEDGTRVGFISTVSAPFCEGCSRVRLTAEGKLVLCMFDEKGYSLKEFLRPSLKREELIRYLTNIVKLKPRGYIALKGVGASFEMMKLGG